MILSLVSSHSILGGPSFKTIMSKEEIERRLDLYRGILSPEAREYLDSLVNLEFSVLKSNIICEKDRAALSQLDIYKSLAQYNVYHRAIKIFQNQEGVNLKTNDGCYSGVQADAFSGKSYGIMYVFNHNDRHSDYGTIEIVRIKEDIGQREKEIADLKEELKYTSLGSLRPNVNAMGEELVGANSMAYAIYEGKVAAIKDRIKELESASSLSEDDKKIMELTNHFHDLILDDYGVTLEDENNDELSHTTQKQKVRLPHFDVYRYTEYK